MDVIYLALATAAVSVTVAKSHAFEPLRKWTEITFATWPMIGKLVRCPYCISHWVAFILALVCSPQLVDGGWLVNLLVTTFAVVSLAAIITGAILRLLWMQESEIDHLRDLLAEAQDQIRSLLSDEQRH